MSKLKLAIAAALVAVLVAGAYMIGRSADSPPSRTAAPAPGGSSTPSAAPPALSKGGARAKSQGTYLGPGGLPQGFPRTQDGAVEAATAYNHYFLSGQWQSEDDLVSAFIAASGQPTDEQRQSFLEMKNIGMQEDSTGGAYAVTSHTRDVTDEVTVYLWHRRRNNETEPGRWRYFWVRADMLWMQEGWRWQGMWDPQTGSYGTGPEPGDLTAALSASEKSVVLGTATFAPATAWREYADS